MTVAVAGDDRRLLAELCLAFIRAEQNTPMIFNPSARELGLCAALHTLRPAAVFADVGNGDQFAFLLRDGRKDIFAWDHEDDSRTWVAPDLDKYVTWWLDGTLQL